MYRHLSKHSLLTFQEVTTLSKTRNQLTVIHTVEHWLKDLLLATGPEAEARRARALPLIGQDGTRMPDLFGLGPEMPIGETVRRRFFGEE
jgi:hypothetical protein